MAEQRGATPQRLAKAYAFRTQADRDAALAAGQFVQSGSEEQRSWLASRVGQDMLLPETGGAKWIRFRVSTSDYTTSDATFTATIDLQSDTDAPETAEQTIHNLPSKEGGYVFAGKVDQYGLAMWNQTTSEWHVWQQECEPTPPPTGYRPIA